MWRSARDDNAAPSGAGNSTTLSKEHRLLRGYRTATVEWWRDETTIERMTGVADDAVFS